MSTFCKLYIMTAKAGEEVALGKALADLKDKVEMVGGCTGVQLMHYVDASARYVFIETWQSQEAYRAGSAMLGKEVFGPAMAPMAELPEVLTIVLPGEMVSLRAVVDRAFELLELHGQKSEIA